MGGLLDCVKIKSHYWARLVLWMLDEEVPDLIHGRTNLETRKSQKRT